MESQAPAIGSCFGVYQTGQTAHASAEDVTPVSVPPLSASHCPLAKSRFQDQMGWGLPWVSCDVDLDYVVVRAGQHHDLACLAAIKHLARAEGFQTRYGYGPRRLVVAAHRVHAASTANARRVSLILQAFIQQGQVVILQARILHGKEDFQQLFHEC